MADIRLSEQDIDYIARVVATEVPGGVRRNPLEYNRMVGAVVDTVTNRLASGRYGSTVKDVLNQDRAFSKIAGPKRINPYGSVENAPKAPKYVQSAVDDYIAARARGKKSEIKGGTDYANPNFSDASNLRRWVNPMIEGGALKLGLGNAVHFHGTAPGNRPAPAYDLKTPDGFMPAIDSEMRYQNGAPIPTPRPPMALMANAKAAEKAVPVKQPIQARAFAQGGILGPSANSLNPVGTANAGEMPVSRKALPPIQRASIPYAAPNRALQSTPANMSQKPYPMSVAAQRPVPAAQPMADRIRPMPSGPVNLPQKPTAIDPAVLAANYGYYGQTRSLAPQLPINSPSIATGAPVATPQQIAGPLAGQGIAPSTFPPVPAKPTFGQKVKGTLGNVLSPENLKKAGGAAIGSMVAGPVGGIIGGLLAGEIGKKGQTGNSQGLLGSLASALGGGGYQNPMQSTYIGNGVNAVSNAMWGNRRGDTATYNSQGGGSVTNLGGGQYQRTSNKYGWTETTHADGSKSIKFK